MNFRNVLANTILDFKFTTNAADGRRIAFSDALELGDIRIYKNNSTTERTSTAGWTITNAFDSLVGVHHMRIDLSNNSDAGFYSAGAVYDVVLYPDTETIDGKAPSAVIYRFGIEANQDLAAYNGAIWLDSAAANTNTVLGVDGRPRRPVSTVAAAITLANSLGTRKIMVRGVVTAAQAISGYAFEGWAGQFVVGGGSEVILSGAFAYTGNRFKYLTVRTEDASSTFGTGNYYEQCWLPNATGNSYLLGIYRHSTFTDSTSDKILLGKTIIEACTPGINTASPNNPTLSFSYSASSADLVLRDVGPAIVILKNMTSAFHQAQIGGSCIYELQIAASCTAGRVYVAGRPPIVNSGSNTVNLKKYVVDADTVITNPDVNVVTIEGGDATDQIRESVLSDSMPFAGADIATILASSQLSQYEGAAWFDASASNTGTTLGTDGTPSNPNSDWASVKAIADALGTRKIKVSGTLPLAAHADGYVFEAWSPDDQGLTPSEVVLNAGIRMAGCMLKELFHSTFTTADVAQSNRFLRCRLRHQTSNNTQLGGIYQDCEFDENQKYEIQENTTVLRGHGTTPVSNVYFDLAHASNDLQIINFGAKQILLSSVTTNNLVTIHGKNHIQLDVSDTGGNLHLVGDFTWTVGGSVTVIDVSLNGLLNWAGVDLVGGASMIEDDGGDNRWTAQALETTRAFGIKKNTALAKYKFAMRSSTTGELLAGLTVTAERKLGADAAWAGMVNSGTIRNLGSGAYDIDIDAADSNGDTGVWKFTAPGASTTLIAFKTEV